MKTLLLSMSLMACGLDPCANLKEPLKSQCYNAPYDEQAECYLTECNRWSSPEHTLCIEWKTTRCYAR